MKFSLIVATIHRTEEAARFLASLAEQTHRDVQLIVVDQNTDDRLDQVLARARGAFPILHLRSAPGLSRARNLGLQHVKGDVVAFPDDDCWYDRELLQRVKGLLESDPALDGVTGRSVDAQGKTSGGLFASDAGPVGLYDVWLKATSFTIFLRTHVCHAVGGFDESLGLGAQTPFGSAEDTDYIIRAISSGARLAYRADLTVFHPNKVLEFDDTKFDRARSYGAGMGRVLVKHNYPGWFRARALARPVVGCLLAACQLQFKLSRFRWNTTLGRLQGMLSQEEMLSAHHLPPGPVVRGWSGSDSGRKT